MRKSTILSLAFLLLSTFMVAQTCYTAQTGSWNDASTWAPAGVPSINDNVVIKAGHNITVTNSMQCKNLTVLGSITCNAGTLTIGNSPDGGGNLLDVSGTFDLKVGAKVRLNGSIKFETGSTFKMSGGQLTVDAAGSGGAVADGTPIMDFTNLSSSTVTGGTIIIPDPHQTIGNFVIKGTINLSGTATQFGEGVQPVLRPYVIDDNVTFGDLVINYIFGVDGDTGDIDNLSFGVNNVINGDVTMTSGYVPITTDLIIRGNLNINDPDPSNLSSFVNCNGAAHIVMLGTPSTVGGSADFGAISLQVGTTATQAQIVLANELLLSELNLSNGTVTLNNYNLKVSNSVDGTPRAGNLVVTNGTGYLIQSLTANIAKNFPIGKSASSYTPVEINSIGQDEFWSAKASNRLNGKPAPAEYGLNMEWEVKPQTLGRLANLNFEWDDSDETITLSQNRSKAALCHFGAGTWTAITPVTTPNSLGTRHSITKTNWNQFSPFGVFVYLTNLPIELKSFTAKESNGRGLLNWSTVSETNNAGFDVEKSLDGVQFEKIGFVKGLGTTNLVQNYTFTDNNLTQTTYYRLKQLDNDDKFQYSPIVSILSKGEKKTFKAYPNPVGAELTIEANIGGEAQLDILDVTGKVVLSQSINNGIVNISTQSLVRGTYFARILTESEILVQKIIKN